MQSGAILITKWGDGYHKMRQILQSEATLLFSGAGITKCGNNYHKAEQLHVITKRGNINPFLSQCSTSILPENIRKLPVI